MAYGASARVSRWSSHCSYCSREDDVADPLEDMFTNSTTLTPRMGSNSSQVARTNNPENAPSLGEERIFQWLNFRGTIMSQGAQGSHLH